MVWVGVGTACVCPQYQSSSNAFKIHVSSWILQNQHTAQAEGGGGRTAGSSFWDLQA
ncbi:MAG: hypothetical protein ACKESB_03595 [Candidatus Hodgkinia cicadicola]